MTPSNPHAGQKKKMPVFGVIVATYNCEADLQRFLKSYSGQVYPHKRLIVIDGGSTDATVDIIRQCEKEIDFWLSESDKGIYDAWNKGLQNLPPDVEWIQFMGSDDFYHDDGSLERVAAAISHVPDKCLIAYTEVKLRYPNGKERIVGTPFNRRLFFSTGNMVQASTVQIGFFHHKRLFQRYGLYDTSFRICSDLEFFFRCFKKEAPILLNAGISVVHTVGGISSAAPRAFESFREKERIFEKYGYTLKRNRAYWLRKASCYTKQTCYRIFGERITTALIGFVRKFSNSMPMETRDPELIEN